MEAVVEYELNERELQEYKTNKAVVLKLNEGNRIPLLRSVINLKPLYEIAKPTMVYIEKFDNSAPHIFITSNGTNVDKSNITKRFFIFDPIRQLELLLVDLNHKIDKVEFDDNRQYDVSFNTVYKTAPEIKPPIIISQKTSTRNIVTLDDSLL